MKTVLAVVIVIAGLISTAADASADEWTTHDWWYSSLSGAGGGAAGSVAGGLVGSLLDGDCLSDDDCLPAFTIAGIGAGLIIGSAYGVSWYGHKRGHDGSFGSAVFGAVIGNVASGSVVALTAMTVDNGAIGFPIVIGAMLGLPAVGATIAYKRSRRSTGTAGELETDELRTSAALLEITPERVAVQAPIVGWAVTDGETAVYVPLAGGQF